MEKRFRAVQLFDLYSTLMTDKRSEALRLYLEEDLSLSEIASLTGVSRQAVHDAILRAEKLLEGYEAALKLLEKRERRTALLEEAAARLRNGDTQGALSDIQTLIDEE